MSFDPSKLQADSELKQFIEAETQRQQFQVLVHALTDKCWDLCVDKPSNRLDGKAETCLNNCVDRFFDTSNFIVNRLEKASSLTLAGGASEFDN